MLTNCKSKWKWMLAVLVIFVIAVPFVSFGADSGTVITATDEASLTKAVNTAKQGTVIKINKSIRMKKSLDIPSNAQLTIKGNTGTEKLTIRLSEEAYKSAQRSETTAMVTVQGKLTIEALTLDAENNLRVMHIAPGGNVTLNKGAIITNGTLGKNSQNHGAGINMQGSRASKAQLTLNSGSEIKNNKAYGNGSIEGIGICNYKYGTVTMNGGKIKDNKDLTEKTYRYFSYGGGIAMIGTEAKFIMKGGSISGNQAKAAGGGVYANNGTDCFVMNGGTISKNKTCATGGGVYVGGASATMKGGTISGNVASSNSTTSSYATGGGVYIYGSSENDSKGTFTLKNGTISNNIAKSTASRNDTNAQIGQGGGIMADGILHIEGGTITGNQAVSGKAVGEPAACGGGISVKGGTYPGTAIITGGTISKNTAGNKGGGIYLNNESQKANIMYPSDDAIQYPGFGKLLVSGNFRVLDNKVGTAADNVYLTTGTALTITDELSDQTKLYVGSEKTAKGTVVGEADEDYDISASDARTFISNKGKKIYDLDRNGKVVISEEHIGDYKDISSASISGIQDSYVYTGTAIKPLPTVKLGNKTLIKGTDYTISYKTSGSDNTNVSTATVKGIVKIIGAGDYKGSISKTFNITVKDIAEIQIEDISKRIYSGEPVTPRIRAFNNGTRLVQGTDFDVTYSDNQKTGSGSAAITGKGNYTGNVTKAFQIISADGLKTAGSQEELESVLASSQGTTEIYILKNIALSGTVTIPSNASVRLIGGGDDITISASQHFDELFRVRGQLTIENITVDCNNRARGFYVETGAKLEISDNAVITGGNATRGSNSAENSGGAVYNKGTLYLTAGELYLNRAENGGAVFNAGTLLAENVSLHENTASMAGGAIFNSKDASLKSGTIVFNNKAETSVAVGLSGAGGGIYNEGTLTCDNGCTIEKNNAGYFGGGIYTAGVMYLKGGNICKNVTSGGSEGMRGQRSVNCGGGIFVFSGLLQMDGGTIDANTAKSTYSTNTPGACYGAGGGIYISNRDENGTKVVMNGGIISNNRAESLMNSELAGNGGGIFVLGGENKQADNKLKPGTFVIKGGSVISNQASGSGSGIYLSNKEEYTVRYDSYEYIGEALCYVQGDVGIYRNGTDNVYLTEGTKLMLSGALSGSANIGITAAGSSDVIVAEGYGYSPANSDASKFHGDTGSRTVELNQQKHIILKAADLSECASIKMQEGNYAYTGKAIKPKVQVIAKDGSVLKENQDYTVEYDGEGSSGKKLINVGIKKVIATGIGDYTGVIEGEYEITPQDIAKVQVSVSRQVYTGTAMTPNLTSITYNGTALLKGSDYKAVYSNNINIGTAKVNITGYGNFTGTKIVKFDIVPKKPAVTKLVSSKKGQLTVTCSKDTDVSGYQVITAYDSKFTKGKKTVLLTKNTKVSATFKNLKSKKTYYVKVRSYKTVSNKKYYSTYSQVKTIKTR